MSFDAIPIWALFLGSIVLIMLAIDLGFMLGRAVSRRSVDEKESSVSAVAGAILGFAAFMLAFSFGIVAERYDSKRALVREDANAIRTAWQRSDFLPESDRARASAMLREYVDARITFTQGGSLDPEVVGAAMAETKRLQAGLWDMAVENARRDMNSDVAALYIDALNKMNEVHALRVAVGIQARVPIEVWIVLIILTTLAVMCLGYQMGVVGPKRSMVAPVLALSFGLVIGLIASLDRPNSGVMRVTQRPLIDLRAEMTAPE